MKRFRAADVVALSAHRPEGYVEEVMALSTDAGDGFRQMDPDVFHRLAQKYRGVSTGGAGTELKKLLARIGITPSKECKCNARARAMDVRGIAWCRANVETIVDWLQEAAADRGLPFVRLAGWAIVNLAIRRAITSKGEPPCQDLQQMR